MAKYKLVPELDGIEIYFDEKPSADIRSKLVANRWRWNGVKGCWYTKQSQQAEKLAKELCNKSSSGFISKPTPPIKPVGNSVSFEQKSNTFTTKIYIKKEKNTYSWSSTNNQIACADCNRFFSIHAPACIFCGCPIIHTITTLYNREYSHQEETKILNYKNQVYDIIKKENRVTIEGHIKRKLLQMNLSSFEKIVVRSHTLYNYKEVIDVLEFDWWDTVSLSDEQFQKLICKLEKRIEHKNYLEKNPELDWYIRRSMPWGYKIKLISYSDKTIFEKLSIINDEYKEKQKEVERELERRIQERKNRRSQCEEIELNRCYNDPYYNDIQPICDRYGVRDDIIWELAELRINRKEVRERLEIIERFKENHPKNNIRYGDYILYSGEELNKKLKDTLKSTI